jgi:hypothetical protein
MTIRTAEDMRAAAIAAAENERVPSAETTDAFYNIGISHAINAISALPVASEWRPISELPDDNTGVIFTDGKQVWPFNDDDGYHKTHWMPFPSPPHVAPDGLA